MMHPRPPVSGKASPHSSDRRPCWWMARFEQALGVSGCGGGVAQTAADGVLRPLGYDCRRWGAVEVLLEQLSRPPYPPRRFVPMPDFDPHSVISAGRVGR